MQSIIIADKKSARIIIRLIALILLICFVAVPLLAEVFIITRASHECFGEACPACAQIHKAESLLEQIGKAAGIIFLAVVVMAIVYAGPLILELSKIHYFTLVDIKVRMNN